MNRKARKMKRTKVPGVEGMVSMDVNAFTDENQQQRLTTEHWRISEGVSTMIAGVSYAIYVPQMLHREVMSCVTNKTDNITVTDLNKVQLAVHKTTVIKTDPDTTTKPATNFNKKRFKYDPNSDKFLVPPQDILIPVPPISPPPDDDLSDPLPFNQMPKTSSGNNLDNFPSQSNNDMMSYMDNRQASVDTRPAQVDTRPAQVDTRPAQVDTSQVDTYAINNCGLNDDIAKEPEQTGYPPSGRGETGAINSELFDDDVIIIDDDDDDVAMATSHPLFLNSITTHHAEQSARWLGSPSRGMMLNSETTVDAAEDDILDDGATDHEFLHNSSEEDGGEGYTFYLSSSDIENMVNHNSTLSTARTEMEKQKRLDQLREHLRYQQEAVNCLKQNQSSHLTYNSN